jgi:hypothetical protein
LARLDEFVADVAAVYLGDRAKGSFGTRRLIAPNLVLTAGHVVDCPTRGAPIHTGWKVARTKPIKGRSANRTLHKARVRQPDADLIAFGFRAGLQHSRKRFNRSEVEKWSRACHRLKIG